MSALHLSVLCVQTNGAPEQKAVLSRTELPGENLLLRAIAAQDLSQGGCFCQLHALTLAQPSNSASAELHGSAGEVVLSIPEHSVITLDRVLEDEVSPSEGPVCYSPLLNQHAHLRAKMGPLGMHIPARCPRSRCTATSLTCTCIQSCDPCRCRACPAPKEVISMSLTQPAVQAVTELLTTGKLSELALLTLYLMYEKKRGKESVWRPFIQALDRQRGRGQQGAKSPLLWDPGQAEHLLAGSPILADLRARLAVRLLTGIVVVVAAHGLVRMRVSSRDGERLVGLSTSGRVAFRHSLWAGRPIMADLRACLAVRLLGSLGIREGAREQWMFRPWWTVSHTCGTGQASMPVASLLALHALLTCQPFMIRLSACQSQPAGTWLALSSQKCPPAFSVQAQDNAGRPAFSLWRVDGFMGNGRPFHHLLYPEAKRMQY